MFDNQAAINLVPQASRVGGGVKKGKHMGGWSRVNCGGCEGGQ